MKSAASPAVAKRRRSAERAIMSVSSARQGLADVVNRVAYAGERIVLGRRGKSLAALVPVGDLEAIEAIEDRIDTAKGGSRSAPETFKSSPERSYDNSFQYASYRDGRKTPPSRTRFKAARGLEWAVSRHSEFLHHTGKERAATARRG